MRAILTALTLTALAAPALAAVDTLPRTSGSILQPGPLKSCQALAEKTAQGGHGPMLKRLDQLPPSLAEHAVLRTIQGCPVREVVYEGRTVWIQPSAPTIQTLQR